MTIRKILELIDTIISKIGEQSFSQRLKDYIVTIQNNTGNLVLLKEITDKTIADYQNLLDNDLHEMLERILVNKATPFTKANYLNQLEELKSQNIPDPGNYYNTLNGILIGLHSEVNANIVELNNLGITFTPFLSKDYSELQGEDNAIFAIIFNNDCSTKSLKTLSFELKNWDRGLFIYQQVISDKNPKAFEIIEIEQGSIEVVINLIFDVGEKLLELFKTGFEVYGSYLAYKTIVYENLIKSYRGNEQLIKSEEEREKLLLENVRFAIKDEINKQVKQAKKHEALEKKIEEVTKLVTDHIIKGNSLKLLSAPSTKEDVVEKEAAKEELFLKNKINFSKLDASTKQLLLDTFTTKPKEDDYEKD